MKKFYSVYLFKKCMRQRVNYIKIYLLALHQQHEF